MGIIKTILPERIYTKYLKLISRISEEKIVEDDENTLNKRIDFYKQFIKKDDIVFDVGANFGNRIYPFLSIGCKVIAVEPQKKCSDFLKQKFGNKIELVTKGLSNKSETKTLYISGSSTISSFSKEWIDKVKDDRFKYYEWNEKVEIEMTTLEHLIQTYGQPTFIKIDVEGYEWEVIQGLKTPINYISIEYNVPENTDKTIQCIEYLHSLNNNCLFNYSIGESMQLAYTEWFSKNDFIEHIKSENFIKTSFGDIYIKSI